MSDHALKFADVLGSVLTRPDVLSKIEELTCELVRLRDREGRLFVLGVGGGAANAAHVVNDLRKLCGIEAYAPTDSVAELTARTNDEGWDTVFVNWLKVSRPTHRDAVLVLSVGGGASYVSKCISVALGWLRGMRDFRYVPILGIVGRPDGDTAKLGDIVVVVGNPEAESTPSRQFFTPITETVQIAVLHALVSDPRLQTKETKW